jgi:hypothetical protein
MSGFPGILLLDDFDYAVGARVHQDWTIVDNRIPIFADTIFRWNIVVGHASFWKNCAYPHVPFVPVGRTVLFDDIVPEARALIYAENTVYATDDPSDSATDNGSHRSCSSLTFARATIDAFGHSLSRSCNWGDDSCCHERRR